MTAAQSDLWAAAGRVTISGCGDLSKVKLLLQRILQDLMVDSASFRYLSW